MQPLPEPSAVLPLLGAAGAGEEPGVARLLAHAAAAARNVTRGVGFGADGTTVEPEIADVLVRGVVRSLLNPELPLAAGEAPFGSRPGSFADWSDADFVILARYRASVARLKPGGTDDS
jgi:hypothetical protein